MQTHHNGNDSKIEKNEKSNQEINKTGEGLEL